MKRCISIVHHLQGDLLINVMRCSRVFHLEARCCRIQLSSQYRIAHNLCFGSHWFGYISFRVDLRSLSGDSSAAIFRVFGYSMSTIRLQCSDCSATGWRLFGYSLATVRLQSGDCLKLSLIAGVEASYLRASEAAALPLILNGGTFHASRRPSYKNLFNITIKGIEALSGFGVRKMNLYSDAGLDRFSTVHAVLYVHGCIFFIFKNCKYNL